MISKIRRYFGREQHSQFMLRKLKQSVDRTLSEEVRAAEMLSEFRSAIEGEVGSPSGKQTIILACDPVYFRDYAINMIRSFELHGQGENLHVHISDPDRESWQAMETLTATCSNVAISWTHDEACRRFSLERRALYYACIRFIIAHYVMQRVDRPIFCADVDSIVRGPVGSAVEKAVDGVDLAVFRRPRTWKIQKKVLVAGLGVNATPVGKRFIADLATSLLRGLALRPSFHIDQVVTHYLVERYFERKPLSIRQMPPALVDFDFTRDGVIWTAKGPDRRNSELYRLAMEETHAAFNSLEQRRAAGSA